jgi:hypothetical protein
MEDQNLPGPFTYGNAYQPVDVQQMKTLVDDNEGGAFPACYSSVSSFTLITACTNENGSFDTDDTHKRHQPECHSRHPLGPPRGGDSMYHIIRRTRMGAYVTTDCRGTTARLLRLSEWFSPTRHRRTSCDSSFQGMERPTSSRLATADDQPYCQGEDV